MIREAIKGLMEGRSLTAEAAQGVMGEIMAGEATEAQIAGFLVALRLKGETPEEILGCARAMREKCLRVPVETDGLVDTCGTGGDGAGTMNISTASAFVAAGAGARIAKHGNRAVSSRCGSADVLASLGVRLELTPAEMGRAIDQVGIGFLFAPALHPAMKHALAPRRELGIRTIFNILGPLTNPAGARRQLLGVFHADLTEPLAEVLRELGAESAMVVHGLDGLDELTITGASRVSRFVNGRVETSEVRPEDVGLARAPLSAIRGGTSTENAESLEAVLDGEPGPRRDVVLLNAGAALVVAGIAEDLTEGVEQARRSIDSGAARAVLRALRDFTQERVTEEQ